MQNLSLGLAALALVISLVTVSRPAPKETSASSQNNRLHQLEQEIEFLKKDLRGDDGAAKEGPRFEDPEDKDDRQAKRDPNEVSPEDVEAMDDEMGDLAGELPPLDPVLTALVRRIIRAERQRHRGNRWNRRLNRFVDEMEQRLVSNEATAGLSDDERKDVSDSLTKEREQIHELIRALRRGDKDVDQARRELSELRRGTTEELRELLGDDIANVVDQLSPLPRRGPFAPGRGNGPTGPQ